MIRRKCKEFSTFMLYFFPEYNKPPQSGLGFCQSYDEPRMAIISFSLVGLHTSLELYYHSIIITSLSFGS